MLFIVNSPLAMRTYFKLIFLPILFTCLKGNAKQIDVQQAYNKSQWGVVINELSNKESINTSELVLLVKSYADSGSFLQINSIKKNRLCTVLAKSNKYFFIVVIVDKSVNRATRINE